MTTHCELLEIDRRNCVALLRQPALFEAHHDVVLDAALAPLCRFVRETIEDAALRTGGESRTVLFVIGADTHHGAGDARRREPLVAATILAERNRPFCAELLCLPLPQLRSADAAQSALATLLERAAGVPGVLEIATRLATRHPALELALRWNGFAASSGNGAHADGCWRVTLATARRRREG